MYRQKLHTVYPQSILDVHGLSNAPAPTSMLQGLVVCAVSDKLGGFFPLPDAWIAGWSHAGRVSLSDASCARDQRKPCSRSRPSVCAHSNGPAHELTRQEYGSIYTKFTKLDRLKVKMFSPISRQPALTWKAVCHWSSTTE